MIMPKLDLDTIDCRIITELQADARLSNVELAERVGLSPSPCLRRVKRLERDGYIIGYRAALRRERVGLGFSVFVGVKIDSHANERALTFEEAVCALTGGDCLPSGIGRGGLFSGSRGARSRALSTLPCRQAPEHADRSGSEKQHRHSDGQGRRSAATG